jgi:hypothetical protein
MKLSIAAAMLLVFEAWSDTPACAQSGCCKICRAGKHAAIHASAGTMFADRRADARAMVRQSAGVTGKVAWIQWLIAAAALNCGAAPANARPVSLSSIQASMIVEECAKRSDLVFDPCVGYITGVMDGLSLAGKICVSEGAATLRAVGVTRKYLRDHPERWNLHAAILVEEALLTIFRCPPDR